MGLDLEIHTGPEGTAMATTIHRRMTAEIEGDFAIFLVGASLSGLWKIWKLPHRIKFIVTMPRMLRELTQKPELGLLGFEAYGMFKGVFVQYWRSWEHLENFARSKEATHYPAWVWFNQNAGAGSDIGIWHETYLVRAGDFEVVYNNMPPSGLGRATKLVPASGRLSSAADRLGREPQGEAPPDSYDRE